MKTETKQCTKCTISKPFSEYYKDRGGVDGYRTQCKSCITEVKRVNLLRKLEQYKNTDMSKLYQVCTTCNTSKNLTCYTADSAGQTLHKATCVVCVTKQKKVRLKRIKNKEYV